MKNALLCDNSSFVDKTTPNHDITFVPYTTKQYLEKYKSTAYPILIEVYQMQIGNTKYIDIATLNKLERSVLKKHTIVPAVIVVIVILIMRVTPLRRRLSKTFSGM